MKKLITIPALLLVLISITMVSCEKEKSLNELIAGKWDVLSIKQVTYEDNIKLSETTVFTRPGDFSIQFVDGGTGIQFEEGEAVGVFSWTLSSNILQIMGGTQIYSWTITIDNDVLVWSFEDSETIDGTIYKYEYFYSAGRIN